MDYSLETIIASVAISVKVNTPWTQNIPNRDAVINFIKKLKMTVIEKWDKNLPFFLTLFIL